MPKILVVEDDANIALALSIRLRQDGHSVVHAVDGICGVTVAVKEKPDLIILDISMPAGGGFRVAERVRENVDLKEVPLIFMTASKQLELREQAAEFSPVAFFDKPYEKDAVLCAVNVALGRTDGVSLRPRSDRASQPTAIGEVPHAPVNS